MRRVRDGAGGPPLLPACLWHDAGRRCPPAADEVRAPDYLQPLLLSRRGRDAHQRCPPVVGGAPPAVAGLPLSRSPPLMRAGRGGDARRQCPRPSRGTPFDDARPPHPRHQPRLTAQRGQDAQSEQGTHRPRPPAVCGTPTLRPRTRMRPAAVAPVPAWPPRRCGYPGCAARHIGDGGGGEQCWGVGRPTGRRGARPGRGGAPTPIPATSWPHAAAAPVPAWPRRCRYPGGAARWRGGGVGVMQGGRWRRPMGKGGRDGRHVPGLRVGGATRGRGSPVAAWSRQGVAVHMGSRRPSLSGSYGLEDELGKCAWGTWHPAWQPPPGGGRRQPAVMGGVPRALRGPLVESDANVCFVSEILTYYMHEQDALATLVATVSQRRTLDLAARCDHMALWASFDAFPARIRLSVRHDSIIPCVPMGPPIRCREVPRRRALTAALGFGTALVLRARSYISSG